LRVCYWQSCDLFLFCCICICILLLYSSCIFYFFLHLLRIKVFIYLTDLSNSPVRCSHFTLGSPKITLFSTVLFIHSSDYNISEENKLQLLSCSLDVYLLLLRASYYLHSSITASGARYRRSACIEYQSEVSMNNTVELTFWDFLR